MTAATEARVCLCGASIEHLRRDARTCSPSCRAIKHRGDVYLPAGECEECGDRLPEGSRAHRRYCGDTCRKRARRRQIRAKAVRVVNTSAEGTGCRCGGTATYLDEDGDRCCAHCGRRVP